MALLADMGGPMLYVIVCGVPCAAILLFFAIVVGGFWIARRMVKKNQLTKKKPNVQESKLSEREQRTKEYWGDDEG